MNFLLKLLGAKKRREIRKGKLWEVTRIGGIDFYEVEQKPVQADPFQKPEEMQAGKMNTHTILPEDNVTNLTKKSDLI